MEHCMRLSIVIVALVLAAASGCGSKTPSQKAEAQERWNNTRATILLGVAQDQYKAQDFDKCRETLTKAGLGVRWIASGGMKSGLAQQTPTKLQLVTRSISWLLRLVAYGVRGQVRKS